MKKESFIVKKNEGNGRSRWIDIKATVIILSLVVSGVFFTLLLTMDNKKSIVKKSSKVLASTITNSTNSNYPGIKIVSEISNDEVTHFALQYPQSDHNSFNEKIKSYIEKIKMNYLDEMADYNQLGGKLSGELNVSFKTIVHHSGNYSFVFMNTSYIGSSNGSTEVASFHLNPKTGKEITVEDLFDNDLEKLVRVSTLVREKLVKDDAIKDYLIVEEMNTHTEPVWTNFSNFALTNDSVIFYFDKHQIAAGAAGVPIVVLPIENIDKLIASDYKSKKPIADKENDNTSKTANKTSENKNEDDSKKDKAKDNTKQVALTFDDGPDPEVTTAILATLKKYDAKATFFMLGSRVEYYPEIAKNVEKAGHELGNHTWNHPDLTKASSNKVNSEIAKTSSIIKDVTGKNATVFRPPYGAANDSVRAQTDLPSILWDVDTLDWKHRNANELLRIVKSSTQDGSIILMHDIHQSTADGLDSVLAHLKKEGFTFVTVSELD